MAFLFAGIFYGVFLSNFEHIQYIRVVFLFQTKNEPFPNLLQNVFKKRLQHRCFSVKFAKFLRTTFFTEHLRCLFLSNQMTPRKIGELISIDTGHRLNLHKTFKRRPGRLTYVQFTSCVYGVWTRWNNNLTNPF